MTQCHHKQDQPCDFSASTKANGVRVPQKVCCTSGQEAWRPRERPMSHGLYMFLFTHVCILSCMPIMTNVTRSLHVPLHACLHVSATGDWRVFPRQDSPPHNPPQHPFMGKLTGGAVHSRARRVL